MAMTPKRPARARARQHAAFGDAENRPRRAFTADMEARITVAGDHESIGRIVRINEAAQRHHHAFHVGLRLDPERTFREGRANDLRAVREPKRIEGCIEISCYVLVRVRIDDTDAAHGVLDGSRNRIPDRAKAKSEVHIYGTADADTCLAGPD